MRLASERAAVSSAVQGLRSYGRAIVNHYRITDADERDHRRGAYASESNLPGGDVTVDEMSDASFPASDAPARWTWEVRATAADADDSDEL